MSFSSNANMQQTMVASPVQQAPVEVKSDVEEYRGALNDTLKINARLQCEVVDKIGELQQLISRELNVHKAHSGDVKNRLETLVGQLAETNRLQQETLAVLSQQVAEQNAEIKEMKGKLNNQNVAGFQQSVEDRFRELFTRLTLGDMERRRQSSETINELKYFPQKYCDDLRETKVRLEKQQLEFMQENRKLTDQMVVVSDKIISLQIHSSQFVVDNASGEVNRGLQTDSLTTVEHQITVNQQENDVHKELQSLAKIVAERNSQEDMLKQMLIDSRRGVKNLKRKLDETTEELRQYQLVAETMRSRQLQESISNAAGNKELKTDSVEHCETTKPEHVSRLQNVYNAVTALLDASSAASWMFQRVALTVRELEMIQANHNQIISGAETLMNILLKAPREVFECFLKALRHTNQEHVYLRIQCPDATWTSEHCEIIRKYYIQLVDKMDTKYSSLAVHLYNADVLSLREKEDIEAELTSTRQNEKLLRVLSRKSAEQWALFLTALDNTGQAHIRRHVTGQTDTVPVGDDDATRRLKVVEQKVDTEIQLKLLVDQLNKELNKLTGQIAAEKARFDELRRQLIAEQESSAEKITDPMLQVDELQKELNGIKITENDILAQKLYEIGDEVSAAMDAESEKGANWQRAWKTIKLLQSGIFHWK